MSHIPKIYRLGDRLTQGIFDGYIVIEEKIDGSQFSFGVVNGMLVCRSKSQQIDQRKPGMFGAAVGTAVRLFEDGVLREGFDYQCEYVARPKHNVLTYDRVPAGDLVLFDIVAPTADCGPDFYYDSEAKAHVARAFGIEPVPCLFSGRMTEAEFAAWLAPHLTCHSTLGGALIEGVVIKNYGRPHGETADGILTAKVVSEKFKERHAHAPRSPKAAGDIIQGIVNSLRTEARWRKAIQHLREAGTLTDSTRDIGPLMAELHTDLLAEEADFIRDALWKGYQREILRGVTDGFPQFYKTILAEGPSVFQQQKL